MQEPIFPPEVAVEIDGELTMAGVVQKYWPEFRIRWNADTTETYLNDYCEIIFPEFLDHPLVYYDDQSFFEDAIKNIQRSNKRRGNKRNRKKQTPYGESVISHFRYLMRLAVKIASRHGICPDVLWGTDFSVTEEKTAKMIRSVIPKRIKKSFSAAEEYKIRDVLLKNPLQPGQYMALLLMWVLGLRNTEACACVFGDILPVTGYGGWYILAVHCSMENATHYIRGRGKTKSFYRFVPIPPLLYEFIMERKNHLEEELRTGRLALPSIGPVKSVADMPIACNKMNWLEHCTRNAASSAGRQLFKDIHFDEDCVYSLGKTAATGLWDNEKDPTAYTFRRHFCTMLKALGFKPAQIEYLMGHKPYNKHYKKKFFANPDMHAALYRQMLNRPVVNRINWDAQQIAYKSGTTAITVSEAQSSIPCRGQHVTIRVIPNEFHKSAKVSLKIIPGEKGCEIPVNGIWVQRKTAANYPPEVDVRYYLYADYRRAEKRHLSKKENERSEGEMS